MLAAPCGADARSDKGGMMGTRTEFAYGDGTVSFTLPEGMEALTLLPQKIQGLKDPVGAVAEALARPTGSASLLSLLREKKPRSITVVVNDETRPTPYTAIFPPLLKVFEEAGIKDDQVVFVIATGIHEPQSDELNSRLYGAGMTKRFRFVNHVATDTASCVDLGKTSSGYDCKINRLAVDCDFLITIGVVMPHYFAGFSGGRKSILPGLAGHDTVRSNHARMVELLDALPSIRQNPVSLEMIEVAQKVGVDFIINTVTNEQREIVYVAAGDLVEAWYAAVDVSAKMYEIPFEEQVDICIAAACGYPRDVNVYQAQKALDHAAAITRPGGTIIWIGECRAGLGEKVFEKWLDKKLAPGELMRQFKENFELGGHKAYAIAKVASTRKVKLISSLSRPVTELLFCSKAENVQAAFEEALKAYGPNASVAILPQGALTLPVRR